MAKRVRIRAGPCGLLKATELWWTCGAAIATLSADCHGQTRIAAFGARESGTVTGPRPLWQAGWLLLAQGYSVLVLAVL